MSKIILLSDPDRPNADAIEVEPMKPLTRVWEKIRQRIEMEAPKAPVRYPPEWQVRECIFGECDGSGFLHLPVVIGNRQCQDAAKRCRCSGGNAPQAKDSSETFRLLVLAGDDD